MNEIEVVKIMIDQYEKAQSGEDFHGRCILCSFYAYDCNRCPWTKFYSNHINDQARCYDWLDRNFGPIIGYPSLKDGTRQSEDVREARARRIMMLKAWLRILEDEDAQRR